MQVKFDIKYERSKKKAAKRIGIEIVEKIEQLFLSDPTRHSLHLKTIVCRRDKNKKSIRVLGSSGFRILISIRDDIAYFQDIVDHDKYDRMTKDC